MNQDGPIDLSPPPQWSPLRDFEMILLRPKVFFGERFEAITLGQSLFLGLLCHWVGELLASALSPSLLAEWKTTWTSMGNGTPFPLPMALIEAFDHWVPLLSYLDPITHLFSLILKTLPLMAAIKLVIRPQHVRFSQTLKCMAVAQTPALFLFVPKIGTFLSFIWSIKLIAQGLEHSYHVNFNRSLFTALAPLLLSLFLVAIFFASIVALLGSLFL